MRIVGRGFIAGNLAGIAGRHPDAVVLAAGVSSTHVTDPAEFTREHDLLADVVRRCAEEDLRLVVLSSASHAMYGSTDVPATELDPVDPVSPYGRHKLALERRVAESGVPWLVLRLSHVVGAGQRPHQLLPAFVEQVRSGVVRLHRDTFRDLVDVRDVVSAVDGLLAAGVRDEVVNVASGTPYPVGAIAEGVRARMGLPARQEVVDATPVRTAVSTARLRAAVPGLAPLGGDAYLERLLDRYVRHYPAPVPTP
ncbi:NAD-dependent epimerase/dehydratase family protein [Umezawaea tangerina]|uniref:Nucleoside-diphosphate-sugar epimerase n=1 Tax=Umezawaea tangerina TaxID=84725 RepID=A0A2T0SGE8_9PSEU|nr:NAD(P)-dependent oxidoreductase [Umezawaea tangerina]PRY32494.1 nucleoside-diphosphate-sugar epimerase [Umezawaea tangerina]